MLAHRRKKYDKHDVGSHSNNLNLTPWHKMKGGGYKGRDQEEKGKQELRVGLDGKLHVS